MLPGNVSIFKIMIVISSVITVEEQTVAAGNSLPGKQRAEVQLRQQ
jgi:hypothetical protein